MISKTHSTKPTTKKRAKVSDKLNWMVLPTLCSVILVGCSSNSSHGNPTTQTGSAQTASTQPASAQTNQKMNDTMSTQSNVEEAATLQISAAVSLKDSLQEIAPLFEASHPNTKLVFNYGSSGMLEQQILQGAPADVFFSAGEKQMSDLITEQVVAKDEEHDLLHNQLVIITPTHGSTITSMDVLERPDFKKIAIGDPSSVPAGLYAKQSLQSNQIWNPLQSKLVFAKDVRQVLSYVETGNADAGFVYKTDAMTSKNVTVSMTVDDTSHDSIQYPVGILKNSTHHEQAKQFYDFLASQQAKQVFEKYGFTTVS